MHMWFWWNIEIKDFLFEGYTITNIYGLLATCLMLCSLAVFFEFMKVLKARLRQRELRKRQENLRTICTTDNVSLLRSDHESLSSNRFYLFVNEFLLWFLQEMLGYGLMLAVMMYNGYIMIAVAIGAGIGYFMFGQTLLKINKENCAVKKESLCFSTCRESDNAVLISNAESSARSVIVVHGGESSLSNGETSVNDEAIVIQ